jgi:hypothetical protein
MTRLIEVQDARLSVATGVHPPEMLQCRAAGGRVRLGGDVIELWGPFVSALVGDDVTILKAIGPANWVLVRARHPGQARIEVVMDDPFCAPQVVVLDITVKT